jgi:hydrogenase-4 component B
MEISQLIGLTAIVLIFGIIGLILIADKYKSLLALIIVLINSSLTTIPAILALTQSPQEGMFVINHLLGNIIVRVDSLSAWFILIINFTSINGMLYGMGYLKAYSHLRVNQELHWVFYTMFHVSMLWVCMFENCLAFLISWELMSLSSLMLVIFEYQNKDTLKAGLNYMIQMHLSVVLLTIGFIWLFFNTGSFNFSSLADLASEKHSILVFIILIIGFAIKAGFIPFHTWLPHAHPAAPSHISGVMSGVIVKLGIYGIMRTIMYLQQDWLIIGEVILGLSVITAIYGIANAALKYDFKQLLAFCTIENIGIIGIGIGLGLIGIGNGNTTLIILGFSAVLLHTLNHSLFKSLLFFVAGNVYQQTHTRNIEQLGGLVKKMPVTALLFLTGAMAIAGLPPLNGFVSEFIIYSGLLSGLNNVQDITQVILMVLTMAGLAIVGGISVLTFTRTFGVIFLGQPRKELHPEPKETTFIMHLPQYLILIVMVSVAIVPQFYFFLASRVVFSSFSIGTVDIPISINEMTENIASIGKVSLLFTGLLLLVFGFRWLLLRKRDAVIYETWGCGYKAPVVKAQYTGSSFARSFGNLFNFMVIEKKEFKKIRKSKLYPGKRTFSTHYFDLLEKTLITPVARRIAFTLNYFQFIQNGQIQSYVIYGLFFIILVFLGTFFNVIK